MSFTVGPRRRRTTVNALTGLNLDVAAGEIVSLLGPNGAGKTTTLRILSTLLRPTSGSARVCGFDVAEAPREVRRRIGYVGQKGSTSRIARVGEEIIDRAMLYGLARPEATSRAKALLRRFELIDLWDRPTGSLSGGQRRRLDIAIGLVHGPNLVVLDEPTTGLDPQARADVWEHIRWLRRDRGVTVVVTTHYLDEADALSDRLVVIDDGSVVANGTPGELKAGIGGDVIRLAVRNAADLAPAHAVLSAVLQDVLTVDGLSLCGRSVNSTTHLPLIVRELDRRSIGIATLDLRAPTLDDVFLDLTGRVLRDAA